MNFGDDVEDIKNGPSRAKRAPGHPLDHAIRNTAEPAADRAQQLTGKEPPVADTSTRVADDPEPRVSFLGAAGEPGLRTEEEPTVTFPDQRTTLCLMVATEDKDLTRDC